MSPNYNQDVKYTFIDPIANTNIQFTLSFDVKSYWESARNVNHIDYLQKNNYNGFVRLDNKVQEIADIFNKYCIKQKYTDWQKLQLAVSFCQSLAYIPDEITGHGEYPKFPLETLYDYGGDCEDTAILCASLLKEMRYDVVLFLLPGHMMTGVCLSGVSNFNADELTGNSFIMNNSKNYNFIETTAKWGIGALSEKYMSSKITVLAVN